MAPNSEWQKEVDRLIAAGQHAQASDLLQSRIGMSGEGERAGIEAQLIGLYVSKSRYREAYAIASRLEQEFSIDPLPSGSSVFLAHVLAASYVIGWASLTKVVEGICRRLLPQSRAVEWGILDAVLWGIYWQDLRRATSHNIFTCLAAERPNQRLRSYAFLCYTLALRGHTLVGLAGLKRAISQARKLDDRALLRSLMVWLGVALQWSSKHLAAIAVHDEFEREFPDAEPFYRIIGQASRLHGRFTDAGPAETAQALETCFAVSFSLKESRNHIQIFGAKAALLALEGEIDESDIFLQKAAKATDRNDNNLDRCIFHRFAAVTYLNANRLDDAAKSLSNARLFLRAFGSPACYRQDLAKIAALLSVARKPTKIRRLHAASGLLFGAARHCSLTRLRRAWRLSWRIVFESHPGYWASHDIFAYLRTQTFGAMARARRSKFENIVLSLTQVLLDPSWLRGAKKPERSLLAERLGLAFPGAKVLLGCNLQECLDLLHEITTPEGGIIFNEKGDSLHVPCAGDRFFVGIMAPLTAERDPSLACGLLLPQVDLVSQDVIEFGLRIVLSQYLHALTEWTSRTEALTNQRNAAIAQTTQMVAHDVRKPFSILRCGLSLLGSSKSHESTASIISRLIPEVNRAMTSVDGLLVDIMEIGSTTNQLIQEAVNPESLILTALNEAFRIFPQSFVGLSYDLRHLHRCFVHTQKINRVFSNIIVNALQVLRNEKSGALWFATRESNGFIEFCIGNGGSYIPQDDLHRLFDAFFTRGKKGGTGLGLAIAQKVVAAHGGIIRCESSKSKDYPDGKVEFFFTLPVARDRQADFVERLPASSSDIVKTLHAAVKDPNASGASGVNNEAMIQVEGNIVAAGRKLGRKLTLLIIDDEAIYMNALSAEIFSSGMLAPSVAILCAGSSDEAIELVAGNEIDLIITDVDMGPLSIDGFELVRELRQRVASNTLICVHSNRMCLSDSRTAIENGADAFLPKPLARMQLLKLLLQAAQGATPHIHRMAACVSVEGADIQA